MENLKRWLAMIAFAIGDLFLVMGSATAADLGPDPSKTSRPQQAESNWTFNFTPYGWMLNINGDVTARGYTAAVNDNFFQIVEKSDSLMALMGYFEARNGRLGLFTDLVWADLSFPAKINIQRNPLSRVNIGIKGHADLDYTETIITTGIAYEVAHWPGQNADSFTALDGLAGARYWNERANLSIHVTGTATVNLDQLGLQFQRSRSIAVAKGGTLEWVDPFVGARLRHQFAPGKQLSLEGDVGGFGAGSDFSWQVVASYGYDTTLFGYPTHAVIGYRALAVDYSDYGPHGKNGFNAVQHGPVVGATVRW